ncbi:membrane protein YfhO [Neolewinella xylanilytica]|uniref:Membrane protein YfhO n=1 Tax=Neolewinella xylanilytica TaxID=1514080 RepID=A0A2S6I4I8_9BACT|nr:YfhO family protein [Neolewinella xylanilytica]PPK86070.1 membrane protein YfhO [Neolewinella xylanilytica]
MTIKQLWPHLLALVLFFLTVVVLFLPQFQGESLQQGDIVQYRGASRELNEFRDQTGERTNWTNAMFGGMPTYQISAVSAGNQLTLANQVFRGFLGGPAGYVFCGMLTFYLMMVLLGVNHWLALAGAIATAIATNNIVLYEAGHVSKLGVIMYLPLVAAGVLLAFRSKYLLGGAVFALGMGLSILANHPQMLYYFGLTLPFLGLAELIRHYQQGTLVEFAKAMGALLVGLALAMGAGASNLLTTSEYLPQSMRGGSVLSSPAAEAGAAQATEAGGLDYDYAMQWSNGFKDMIATYAPLAAGGGSGQEIERDTDFGQAMTRAGFRLPATFQAPLYHGSLPFTEGPIYLGAVAWALFVFGLFTASTTARVWLAGGTALIFLLSMGNNAGGINRLLFDYLPLLNNFRTPNSALSVSAFLMVTLGLLGMHRWIKLAAGDGLAAGRQLKFAGYTAAALGVLVVLLGFTFDFTAAQDAAQIARFTGGQGDVNQLVGALEATRSDFYFDDAMRSLLFVGLTYGAIYLLWKGSLSLTWGAVAIGILALADFAGINSRYLTHDDFQPNRVVSNVVQPSPADQQILQDPDPNYRVLNLSRPLDQDAFTSYFHKSLGGYSAVKMRRYQDLIDGYLARRDPQVINMLNTKYFLIPGEGGELRAQQNPDAFGNAWLVEEIDFVQGADAEFAALGTVEDLRNTAIVEEAFAPALGALNPNGQGTIELTSYAPNRLTYRFRSDSDQLAVFSEIWYGPDLGWEATIDGQPAQLIRANYALRALPVPAGDHEIVMTFAPSSYAFGRTISLVCSVLILFGVVGALVYQYRSPRTSA